jgi:valyl-tRNA synthetase
MPFVTEEVWSWWREGSVPRAPWPAAEDMKTRGDADLYAGVSQVLGEVRRQKSVNGWKTKTPVNVVIASEAHRLASIRQAEQDLRAAVSASSMMFREGQGLEVLVEVEGGTEPRA